MSAQQQKLRFHHVRKLNKDGSVSNRGGATICYTVIYNSFDTNEIVGFQYAEAQVSKGDNFSRRLGRTIATNRYIKGIASTFTDIPDRREALSTFLDFINAKFKGVSTKLIKERKNV